MQGVSPGYESLKTLEEGFVQAADPVTAAVPFTGPAISENADVTLSGARSRDMPSELRVHAAARYSLISPPRMPRPVIR
jgi:hypothetical protein